MKKRYSKRDFYRSLKTILAISIILLAAFLRFWRINEIFHSGEVHEHVDKIPKFLEKGIINHFLDLPFLWNCPVGPLGFILELPFFYIFGYTIISVKLSFVISGTLTILFLYLFTRNFYGEKEALLTSFLLAVFPSHVSLSTYSQPYIYTSFFVALVLYLFYKYYKTTHNFYLFLGGFLCGMGSMVRLSFLFFLISFVLSVLLCKGLLFFKNLMKKIWIILLLFTLGGFYPLIFLNLEGNLKLIKAEIERNFPITVNGIDLRDVPGNFKRGFFSLFPSFLEGVMYGQYNWEKGNIFNFLTLVLCGLIVFIIIECLQIYLSLRPTTHRKFSKYFCSQIPFTFKKDIFLLLCLFFTLLLISTITRQSFHVEEYVMISPIITMIIGKSIHDVLKLCKNIFLLFLVSLIVFSTILIASYNFLTAYFTRSPDINVYYIPDLIKTINEMNYSLIVPESFILSDILEWYGLPTRGNFRLLTSGEIDISSLKTLIEEKRLKNERILLIFTQPSLERLFQEEISKNNIPIIEKRRVEFGEINYTLYFV